MNVTVVGSGSVGTTLAACLLDMGHHVTVIDAGDTGVDTLRGDTPLSAPEHTDLLNEHAGDRLHATASYEELTAADCTFLAIDTHAREDGRVDYGPLNTAAEQVGKALTGLPRNDDHLVILSSLVTPPAHEAVREALENGYGVGGGILRFATNPTFHRERSEITNGSTPDKLVFGTESDHARATLETLYAPLVESAALPSFRRTCQPRW